MTAATAGARGYPKLLDQLRQAIRVRHYSRRTEEAYVWWVRRYIRFSGLRHPRELGHGDVTRFLSSLAIDRRVAASTQNQALSALVFLYQEVLELPVGWLEALVRAKRPARVPVVLTKEEVRLVLERVRGVSWVVAALLYGTGMRLLEALQLRVKDVDFLANEITIRGGKGDRDRLTMLPERLKGPLLHHLAAVRRQHEADCAGGAGWVELPGALGVKYPAAGRGGGGVGGKVPGGGGGGGVAVGVPCVAPVCGPHHRPAAPPSPPRDGDTAGVSGGRPRHGDGEAGELSHAAPLIRHASVGSRV